MRIYFLCLGVVLVGEASFEAKAKAAVAEASASGGVSLGDRTTIIDYGS
jgi:hypothetical protein